MGKQPILVLGATGTTGRRVADRLRAAGFAVRAASRRGEVRFDWSDPGSWEPAVEGAARMYLMAPHELPVDPSFVRCSVEQGVRHSRVAPGDCSPGALTDPDVRISRIRLFGTQIRYAGERACGTGSGYRCKSRFILVHVIRARCERRLNDFRQAATTRLRNFSVQLTLPLIPK